MYYVISLNHTHRQDNYITLWRPDNKGYCYAKEDAGNYEEVDEDYHPYCITSEEAEDLFCLQSRMDSGEWKTFIPNNIHTWRKMGVKMTKNGLVRS